MPTLRSLCCPKDLGNPKEEIGVEFRAARQISENWGLAGGGNSQGKDNREIPGGVSEGEVFRNEGGGVRKERTRMGRRGQTRRTAT